MKAQSVTAHGWMLKCIKKKKSEWDGEEPFVDVSDGSENEEGDEIAEDAVDDLVDPNVKNQFGDNVIASA